MPNVPDTDISNYLVGIIGSLVIILQIVIGFIVASFKKSISDIWNAIDRERSDRYKESIILSKLLGEHNIICKRKNNDKKE